MSESKFWLSFAERDLENARWEIRGRYCEWACFVCEKAVEKALKAVYIALDKESLCNSIVVLVEKLRKHLEIDERIIKAVKFIDEHSWSTYPNYCDSVITANYYPEYIAEKVIRNAEQVLTFCKETVARLENSDLTAKCEDYDDCDD